MRTIIEIIKENKNLIAITILSALTIIFFISTITFMAMCDDLVQVVQNNKKEIEELNSEVERQETIADDWYQMWVEERTANEWLWDYYYSGVSSYDGDYEYYE